MVSVMQTDTGRQQMLMNYVIGVVLQDWTSWLLRFGTGVMHFLD